MQLVRTYGLYMALLIALLGTVGSLYAQYVLMLEPCVLCWWQRIALYPLVPILAVGIVKRDANLAWYAIPLSVFGALVALYQTLLYYGILSEAFAPCKVGVSCTQTLPSILGLNLVTMSLLAFILITLLLLVSATTHEQRA